MTCGGGCGLFVRSEFEKRWLKNDEHEDAHHDSGNKQKCFQSNCPTATEERGQKGRQRRERERTSTTAGGSVIIHCGLKLAVSCWISSQIRPLFFIPDSLYDVHYVVYHETTEPNITSGTRPEPRQLDPARDGTF